MNHSETLQNTLSWLSKLVAMDTRNGTGDEIACVKFLGEAFQAFKPDQIIVETAPRSRGKSDSGYVLAVWGTPKILLNVHIDTVPDGDGWTASPFDLRQDGDKYIGLGTSDIKGAAACILGALGTVQPKNVAVLFSGDEEHGSEIMPAAIARGHYGNAPMAIVCEPTSSKVGRRHRGIIAFSIEASGPGGHSSLADITPAPLLQISRLAAAIGDYGDQYKDFGQDPYKGLCTNIGDIRMDGSYNVIPTSASLKFSLRPPPGDDIAQRESDIREIHKRILPDCELDQIVGLKPFECHNIDAFRSVFADQFNVVDLPFWTEAALLSEAGVNSVVFGPGHLDQAHKPNEYVTGEQLMLARSVYARALSGVWDA